MEIATLRLSKSQSEKGIRNVLPAKCAYDELAWILDQGFIHMGKADPVMEPSETAALSRKLRDRGSHRS